MILDREAWPFTPRPQQRHPTSAYRRAAAQWAQHRLAGLSTHPSGSPVSLTDLQDDVARTQHRVHGYWLNLPQTGWACPRCGFPAHAALAVQWMRVTVDRTRGT